MNRYTQTRERSHASNVDRFVRKTPEGFVRFVSPITRNAQLMSVSCEVILIVGRTVQMSFLFELLKLVRGPSSLFRLIDNNLYSPD